MCCVLRASSHGEIEKHVCMFHNKRHLVTGTSPQNLVVSCFLYLILKKKPYLYFVITMRDSSSMYFFMHEFFRVQILSRQAESYENISHKVPAEA